MKNSFPRSIVELTLLKTITGFLSWIGPCLVGCVILLVDPQSLFGEALSQKFRFDFNDPKWMEKCKKHSDEDAEIREYSDGVFVQRKSSFPRITLKGLSIDIDANPWLIVRMSSEKGSFGGLLMGGDGPAKRVTFPIVSDGSPRTYSIFLGREKMFLTNDHPDKSFKGHATSFSIIPTWEPRSAGAVRSVEFSPTPIGEGFLVPEYTGPADCLYRVARPGPIAVRVRNGGGKPIRGLKAEFLTNGPMKILGAWRNIPDELMSDKTTTLFADIVGWTDGYFGFSVKLTADNVPSCISEGHIRIDKRLKDIPEFRNLKMGEIPPPNPISVPGKDIGVYYYPGWTTTKFWYPCAHYIERRPALGYYDESSPEVADWTIKWAVEHGINFIDFLLYWKNGRVASHEFLEPSLLKSKFLPYIQFFVTWSNDTFDKISLKEFKAFTHYVVDRCFPNSSYKQSGSGKPMLGFYDVKRMISQLGGDPATLKEAMQEADAYAQSKGYKGIFWIAGSTGSDQAKRHAKGGFEGLSFYNYLGFQADRPCAPASDLVAIQRKGWEGITEPGFLSILPITTGFDHRPTRGKIAGLVYYGMTPSLFETAIENAKHYGEEHHQDTFVTECWSEYNESSCVGPYALQGFEMLKAHARVFAPEEKLRPILVPQDIRSQVPEIKDLWNQSPDFPEWPLYSNQSEQEGGDQGTSFHVAKCSSALAFKLAKAVVFFASKPSGIVGNIYTPVKPVQLGEVKTLLPAEFLARTYHLKIHTDSESKMVTIERCGTVIEMFLDQTKARINDREISMVAAPKVVEGQTMLPLNPIADFLGKRIFWDPRGLLVLSSEDLLLEKGNNRGQVDELIKLFDFL